MAYGVRHEDLLTPEPIDDEALEQLFQPVNFGIAQSAIPGAASVLIEELNESERNEVLERRRLVAQAPTPGEPTNAVGLALSGGGIRSATFSLGVVQVLVDRGLFKDIDFLSTVSGGGYTGSLISSQLRNSRDGDAHALGSPEGPDSDEIGNVRRRAQFLAITGLRDAWARVFKTIAGMFLNWSAPLFLIGLIAAVMAWAGNKLLSGDGSLLDTLAFSVKGFAAITLIVIPLYGLALRSSGRRAESAMSWVLGVSSFLLAACMLLWGLEALYGYWSSSRDDLLAPGHVGSTGGLLALAAAAGPAILRFIPWLRRPGTRALVLRALLILASIAVPLVGVAVYFWTRSLAESPQNWWIPLSATLAFGVTAFYCLDINRTSLHQMYRDGLNRTFVAPNGPVDDATLKLTELNRGRRCALPPHQHHREPSRKQETAASGTRMRLLSLLETLDGVACYGIRAHEKVESR